MYFWNKKENKFFFLLTYSRDSVILKPVKYVFLNKIFENWTPKTCKNLSDGWLKVANPIRR